MSTLLRSSGSSILNYVKSIDSRLKILQNKSEAENTSTEFLLDILPVTNIDKMKELDAILIDDERKAAFTTFIKNIGGRHAKDCVHRILKQVYSNNFGVQCSWLGQRNNIRICDTKTMTVIKEIVLSVYCLKVHDFEMIVSEWFRLSKLRLAMEQAGPN